MSNVPSIFAGPGGTNNNNNNNNNSTSSGYTPSAAAGGYVPSAAAAGGATYSSGGYTPSTTAGGYTPSAAASGGGYGGGSSYAPSTTAATGGYVPSAAASGGASYTPAATTSYAPSSTASGGYVPSAAASGGAPYNSTGGYAPASTPSVSNTGGYVPSAAASGGTSYNATPNTRSTAAASSGYVPSAAAMSNVVPPAHNPAITAQTPALAQAPVYQNNKPPGDPTMQQMQMQSATPYANATPLQKTSYQHGNGPTNGVISQTHTPVKCHKIDYEIKGSEMQLVEVHLDPQETVIAEAGGMMYLEADVDFKTKFGDGSEPKQGFFKKLMAGAGRLMTGESLFITHFTNQGQMTRRAAFAAPYPGTILPIDMMELQQLYPSGNPDKPTALICQKDAFLCAAKGTKLEMHLHKKLGSGLFGGEGFILQKLKGDGMAFVHAGGCVIKRELKQGEKLRVDTGCLVAYTSPGIDNDIQMAPGLKTMFFGGEGLFLATLTANSPQGGTVWLQSLPFSRLCDRVIANAPSIGGKRTGEGSRITGGFGDLIDGDGFGGWG